jgi:hypothetical protein
MVWGLTRGNDVAAIVIAAAVIDLRDALKR